MGSDRIALFPGTFDPFTNGHLDLTRRAARLFDRVVVAVAESPAKGALFPMDERVEMIRSSMRGLKKVEVVEFSDLVVDCARRVGAAVIIRGLRAVSDFEFEFQMTLMNRKLSPSLEVAFLMPSMQYTYLNATLVKEVARLGGSVKGLVPGVVEERLRARFGAARPKRAAKPSAMEEDDEDGGAKPGRAARRKAEAEPEEVAEPEDTESLEDAQAEAEEPRARKRVASASARTAPKRGRKAQARAAAPEPVADVAAAKPRAPRSGKRTARRGPVRSKARA